MAGEKAGETLEQRAAALRTFVSHLDRFWDEADIAILDGAIAALDTAAEVLRAVEWRGEPTHEQMKESRARCPCCHGTRDWVSGGLPVGTPIVWKFNHASDCKLAALIGAKVRT